MKGLLLLCVFTGAGAATHSPGYIHGAGGTQWL
jgi:hypothetical protein